MTDIDISSVERVLIIKLSAMGDIIHALPVSAALKRSFPHLSLHWAVEDRFAQLVRYNPYLSGIIELPKLSGSRLRTIRGWRDWGAGLKSVRRAGFELTIDLQGLSKSAAVAVASGAKQRIGYHWLRELAPMIERPVPQRSTSLHIVDQYLDVAHYLGADVSDPVFPLSVPSDDTAIVDGLLQEAGVGSDEVFVSINPASAQRIKEWGPENYGKLVDGLMDRAGIRSVLVTADREVAGAVIRASRAGCVDLSGKTNLLQLADLLRRSAVHVCGDTGSGHIAACFEIPVVTIVGPTDPDRSCPYGQRHNSLSRRDLCGSGCRTHHCQFATPRCLQGVQVEEVLNLVCPHVPRTTVV